MKNILFRGDCDEAMQKLIKEKGGGLIDLIYLDPPFNSNRNYNLIYNGDANAQQKAFHDMWTATERNQQLLLQFESIIEEFDAPSGVKDFLKAWLSPLQYRSKEDKQLLIYLIYMTQRLVLMKKLLKDTGSIYYHCDPTASHYIKIVMDGIFGRENFQNEIIWQYFMGGKPSKAFARKHDVILCYSKNYKNKNRYFNKFKVKRYLDFVPSLKDDSKNGEVGKDEVGYYSMVQCPDVWPIKSVFNMSREYRGYPTQKPEALLDRIIKASCPADGIVLDPFCGCGTTLASAIKNNRHWIGIDISWDAVDVMRNRINELSFDHNTDYEFIDCNPQTRAEYEKLDAYEKQDWLIRKVKGTPNERKSGDGGVDGEVTLCLGIDENGNYKWGKMIFSVKTGKQRTPDLVRELRGSMLKAGATFGGLIMDADPTDGMLATAEGYGSIKCVFSKDFPPRHYNAVQIITSQEIFDGMGFGIPYTLAEMKQNMGDQSSFADVLFKKH